MIGLFVYYSDECTYSYNELVFAFNESQRTSSAFVQKVLELYPLTGDDAILELQTAELHEMLHVEVKDKDGYTYRVSIEKVETL